MTSTAPRIIARPPRPNGVLTVPASATQKKSGPAQEGQQHKTSGARLKIVIRRLPPGLTQLEFEDALGQEWRSAGDKVDWSVYKPGKVSKDSAKPSRPSRVYLHLTKQEHIASLSERVHNTTFNDAKGTTKDSCLLGPPSVEFAPYGRVPSSRPRKDARQGTIDQDPEFIDFLESLTSPVIKSVTVDQENDPSGKSKEKVTVTPLIQFLRDKKANKGKESASVAKSAKHARQDSKENKAASIVEPKPANNATTASSPKKRSAQAVKVEQAARDAVKVLNKQAASKGAAPPTQSTPAVAKPTNAVPSSASNAALADKRRERGNASAAARILQRDLGLDRSAGGRGGRRGLPGNAARPVAASAIPTTEQDTAATQVSTQSGATLTSTTNGAVSAASVPAKTPVVQAPIGPAAQRNSGKASIPAANSTPGSQKPVLPASTSTQAFLKHANPSQGITEPLLEEAFAVFGSINKVEIDKKKGFAYVDFNDAESLQKAIRASPIKVAQGQVVVLERKTGPSLQARNMRGGGQMMGHRGGGMPHGGRGGPIRGRGGGFGRGGANLPNVNNTRSAPAAANAKSSQAPAAASVPTDPSTTAEGFSAPSPDPAPTPSLPTAPAD